MAETSTPIPFELKKGTKDKLPTAKTAGTIYVCTDTGEVYADIDATTRKKLSSTKIEVDESSGTLNITF